MPAKNRICRTSPQISNLSTIELDGDLSSRRWEFTAEKLEQCRLAGTDFTDDGKLPIHGDLHRKVLDCGLAARILKTDILENQFCGNRTSCDLLTGPEVILLFFFRKQPGDSRDRWRCFPIKPDGVRQVREISS